MFFILKKLPYYFSSLIVILLNIENPFSLFIALVNRSELLIKLKNGLVFYLLQPIDLLIIKETILDDVYQLKKLKKNNSYIIDIGAGIGDFCILAGRMYPSANIYAFEPNKEEYKKLLINIKLNGITNIKPCNVAIGTKEKYTFYISQYGVRSSIIKDRFSKEKVTVIGKSLQTYITQPIDLVKIDCEGAELDVLNSLSNNAAKNVNRFVIEYHDHLIPNIGNKVIKILRRFGFNTYIKPDPYNHHSNYTIGYIYAWR